MSGKKETIFKAYLRGLMRQLKILKQALAEKDYERAERIVDELIEDTQSSIED